MYFLVFKQHFVLKEILWVVTIHFVGDLKCNECLLPYYNAPLLTIVFILPSSSDLLIWFDGKTHIAEHIVRMLGGFIRTGARHPQRVGCGRIVHIRSSLLRNTSLNAKALFSSTYGCHFSQRRCEELASPLPRHSHALRRHGPCSSGTKESFHIHPLFSCRGRKGVFFFFLLISWWGWDSWVAVVGSMLKLGIVQELGLLRH